MPCRCPCSLSAHHRAWIFTRTTFWFRCYPFREKIHFGRRTGTGTIVGHEGIPFSNILLGTYHKVLWPINHLEYLKSLLIGDYIELFNCRNIFWNKAISRDDQMFERCSPLFGFHMAIPTEISLVLFLGTPAPWFVNSFNSGWISNIRCLCNRSN